MHANIRSRTLSSRLLSKSLKRRTQDYNFAFCSVWVWNLVWDIKGGTETEDIWEQGAEENIRTEEGWSYGKVEKTA
jgi:hypothetical protein